MSCSDAQNSHKFSLPVLLKIVARCIDTLRTNIDSIMSYSAKGVFSMQLDIYQVDAFTKTLFSGNPAAVVPLADALPEATMQLIAAENNLSETAFFYPVEGGYYLRWFTPTSEVPLCGHATLASARVVFDFLERDADLVHFNSASGWLTVRKLSSGLQLDFPRINYAACDTPLAVKEALSFQPTECYIASADSNIMVVLDSEQRVRDLRPNIRALDALKEQGLIVTAKADRVRQPDDSALMLDFVSRYFAPAFGIDEDPVTGSIHCVLTPFWAARLDKTELVARQVSPRGGDLVCSLNEDRVLISGDARLYMKGQIFI